MHPRRTLTAAGVCLAAGLLNERARAAEPSAQRVNISVSVDAPRDCATDAMFWSALSRRTDRLVRASASTSTSEASAMIDVVLTRSKATTTGVLRIVRSGRASEPRRVVAKSCSEVVDGLSLVAALAFDPAAKLDAISDDEGSDSKTPGKSPIDAAVDPPPSPEPLRSSSPSLSSTDPDDRAFPIGEPHRWAFGIGAAGGGVLVGDPGATVTLGGFGEISSERPGLSPSIRLGAVYSAVHADNANVRAALTWTVGRASVCPVRLDLVRGLSLRPCAGVEGGILAASTRSVATTRDRSRPWLAPTAAARLVYVPSSPLFFELEVAVAAPLVRDEIVVDPSLSVYRAPVLVPSGQIAAGVRFH